MVISRLMNAESLTGLTPEAIAQRIADQLARLPQVTAIALSGSRTATHPDALSDIDLYVYAAEPVPVADRRAIGLLYSDRPQINNQFWEDGDEWIVQQTGLPVDVMYRSPRWIDEQLDRVVMQHEASVGFTTCFWFNVRRSQVLVDRDGWFAALQAKAAQPYSDELQHAIIAKNYAVLRMLEHSSYSHQVEAAVARNDLVNLQNRITAILASYFDILFAVNKQLNPGEKRLIIYAQALAKTPPSFVDEVYALITSVAAPERAVSALNGLLDNLGGLLDREGLAISRQ